MNNAVKQKNAEELVKIEGELIRGGSSPTDEKHLVENSKDRFTSVCSNKFVQTVTEFLLCEVRLRIRGSFGENIGIEYNDGEVTVYLNHDCHQSQKTQSLETYLL